MDWVTSIQSIVDYIEEHLAEELDLHYLASKIYSSEFQFQRMFTILCGCPFGEYIRNRRLTLAGYDLLKSDDTILNIALKYGYDTNESFTRAFTRFHGITPSAARKNSGALNIFSRIIVKSKLTGGKIMLNELNERGYVVKETGAVYYTPEMDRTLQWFQAVLGWYGQIDARNETGTGTYGCVNSIPVEIEALRIAPFTGIHLFHGDPLSMIVGFMLVQGIDHLYSYVKKQGWNQITEVITEPWGARTCTVTTIDGSKLKFFELN